MIGSTPRHTLESVVDELAEGLGNRTIALSEFGDYQIDFDEIPVEYHSKLNREILADYLKARPANWGPLSREELDFVISIQNGPRPTFANDPLPNPTELGQGTTINKGLIISGEIIGSESLFINGKIEGMINVPDSRVTIGKDGAVTASISAREVIVLGKVEGNVIATERVDIRAEGSLTGDVISARISIEDSAFFRGDIEIRKSEMNMPHPSARALNEEIRLA